jgi:hypothetical protein
MSCGDEAEWSKEVGIDPSLRADAVASEPSHQATAKIEGASV